MGETRPNFFLIYLSVFVSVVAFSMIFPLLPLYAKHFQASDTVIGVLAASFALAQLIFSPLWGVLSDRYGRKPIMLIGLAGLAASFLVFAFAANLTALFFSRFIQGMFSGATMPSARAYVADLTGREERVEAMGKIGASLALGVILGPAIGGFLAEGSIVLPFFAAALVASFNLAAMYFLLPESLREKRDYQITMRLAWLSLPRMLQGLKSTLMPLFLLAFVWSFALSNNQVNVPLLATEGFALSAAEVGLGFALMGVVSFITQFFLLGRITGLLGQRRTVAAGLSLMGFSFMAMPFLPHQPLLLYLAMMSAGLGSAVSRPVITALVTEETTEPQGVTLGTASAFEAFGRLLGPLVGGVLFLFGTQAPFLFSGTAAILVVLYVWKYTPFAKSRAALV